MKIIRIFKRAIKGLINRISYIIKSTTNIGANLIGLRCIERRWDYSQLVITGWVFLLGLPIGFIFLGTLFSFPTWTTIVTSTLILYNFSYTIETISQANKERKITKEEQCLYL